MRFGDKNLVKQSLGRQRNKWDNAEDTGEMDCEVGMCMELVQDPTQWRICY